MKVKTYIISLKKAEDRRKLLLKEIGDFSFMDIEWVEAVYGKELSPAEASRLFHTKRFVCRYNRLPYPGEIGCTLSHRECFRRLLESDADVALILEDDVLFLDHKNVESLINESIKLLRKKTAGVLTLSYHRVSSSKGKPFVADYSLYRVWRALGTNAYLIHRNSAKKLLMDAPGSVLTDDYQYINMKGIPVYGIGPFLSTGLSNDGHFKSETFESEEIKPSGIYILLTNMLHRLFRGGTRKLLIVLGIMSVKSEGK